MRRYFKGDKVEVLNMKGTLEDSWHPALIVDGDGDVYIVLYDGHVNGVVEEWVLAKYIRPRPPIVEFSNWSRGDLVHVFDNFAWKLATVLHVSDRKQFLVRVVGSMLDLSVGAGLIRVRHYWQGDQWVVVGKGSSNSDAKQPRVCRNMVLDSDAWPRSTGVRRSTRQKSSNVPVPTKAIKRSAVSTINHTEAHLAKISRTIERTSPSTLKKTQACCTELRNSGIRLRFTEPKALIHPPTATANLRMSQHEKLEDSYLSSSGSCSINSSSSPDHYTTKSTKHHCYNDASDAESCTSISKISKNRMGTMAHNRPAPQRCGLILRIRLQNPSLHGLLL